MKLKVKAEKFQKEIAFDKGENLLKILHSNGIYISAYCGGRGICRKCTVRFLNNPPKPTKLEIETLKNRVDEGYRLACLHNLENEAEIEIESIKPVFAEFSYDTCSDDKEGHIAVDIGTTTIAAAYINNNQLIKSAHILNPQIAFGADVISRIAYSNEGNLDILSSSLSSAVLNIIESLTDKKPASLVICANPTMLAFLLGIDPKPIGEYPYLPPFKGSKKTTIFDIETYIPPVVGAFVGSDITAALAVLPEDEDYLFVDIGTNCEFILKAKDRYFTASVPAGPALEGANIDYGTIAQDGAIYKVYFDGEVKIKTINGKKATGITGSGLISAIGMLVKYGIIDKSGRLVEPWEAEAAFTLINRIKERGFLLADNIYLTQNSIRNFQLVKASLNAGLKLLLKNSEKTYPKKIFIGGGFSRSITKDDIINSRLLSFDGEFVMLGNSALSGSLGLFCKKNREKVERIAEKIEYIEIANQKEFESLYIESMDF